MIMSSRSAYFLVLTLFPVVLLADGVESPDAVIFSFGSQEPSSYTQTLTVTTEQNLMVSQPRQEKTISISKVALKQSATGWTMTVTHVSMTLFQDGRKVSDSMAKMKARIAISYQLDSQGQLQSIGGFDEFIANLASDFGQPIAETTAQMLDIPALKKAARHDWQQMYGVFAGQQFVLGEPQIAQSSHELPNGTAALYPVTTIVSKAVSCPQGQCVQIDQIYGTEKDNEVSPQVIKGGPVVTGNSQRLLDAKTMQYFELVSSLKLHFHKSIAFDGSDAGFITQTRVVEFTD